MRAQAVGAVLLLPLPAVHAEPLTSGVVVRVRRMRAPRELPQPQERRGGA